MGYWKKVPIEHGGTGQDTQTEGFDALDPLTTKGDIAVNNGSDTVRVAVGTDGFVLSADSGASTGVAWNSISALSTAIKSAVRLATTADLDLNGSETIDGVATSTNDRILVKNQSTASQNGIYLANNSGAWTRATDFDVSSEVKSGVLVYVCEGSTQADKLYSLTTDDPITLGSTSLTFASLSSPPGGSNTQVQFNDSGLFGGDSGFTYNKSTDTATLGNLTLTNPLTIGNGGTGQTSQTAAFNALDPLTTKGDLIVHDGTNSVRQAVGSNGDVLIADSTQTNGIRWGAGGSGAPTTAQYLTLATDGTLVNERVFTPGGNVFAVDSGAGAAYTLSSFDVGSSTLSTDTTLTNTDATLQLISTAGGDITVTLPSSPPNGKIFILKRIGFVTNMAKIVRGGSYTIDTDETEIYLEHPMQVLALQATSSDWKILFTDVPRYSPWKQSVKVATTANITLSGNQTIDGVSTSTWDRILVKNQSTPSQNGIYYSNGSSWIRTSDFSSDDTYQFSGGAIISVAEGSTQADTIWIDTNQGGSTALFSQIGMVFPISVANGGTGKTTGPEAFTALFKRTSTTMSGAATLTATDNTVQLFDTNGSDRTVNLPAASGATDKLFIIKKTSAANKLTIDGNSSETIDGQTTWILDGQYQTLTIICDGSAWYIL